MPTWMRCSALSPALLLCAAGCGAVAPTAEPPPARGADQPSQPASQPVAAEPGLGAPIGPSPQSGTPPAPGPARGARERVVTGPSEPGAVGRFATGARVRCRWKSEAREYAGRIVGTSDGRLLVDYDDGDKEAIAPSLCRDEGGASAGAARVVTGAGDPAAAAAWPVGTRARCRWKNGSTEYAGAVVGSTDGRLLIDYDDGDKEAISPSLCRKDTAAAPGATVAGSQLAGDWRIARAANPGAGQAYSGAVRIGARGGAWALSWSIPGSTPYAGVGIELGGILAVGWSQSGASHGVVVYRVDGGRLFGKWASDASASVLGTEDLTGPPGLSGEYAIVAARTPAGGTYAGKVTIRPTGKTYQLEWKLANESYRGVGILRGSVLSAGWGSGEGVGVVSYTIRPGELDGTWAQPGGSEVGVEVLQRPQT